MTAPCASASACWFTEAAIAAWKAEPRGTRGGKENLSSRNLMMVDILLARCWKVRRGFESAVREQAAATGEFL
jgi:hypothetical protein